MSAKRSQELGRQARQPRRSRQRPVRWLLDATAALAGIVMLAVVANVPAAAASTAGGYSSLGDSYASGPVIPQQLSNPAGCQRSNHNYAHLAAARLGLVLDDVSCGGATTADVANPQPVQGGTNPPQIGGVQPATGVVTLQIGGNDIGFSRIIESCVTLVPVLPRCGVQIGGSNGPLAQRIQATAPKVGAVLAAIHERAPRARVVVVGYRPSCLRRATAAGPRCPLPTLTWLISGLPRFASTRCCNPRRRPTTLATWTPIRPAGATMRARPRVCAGSSRSSFRSPPRTPCTPMPGACRAWPICSKPAWPRSAGRNRRLTGVGAFNPVGQETPSSTSAGSVSASRVLSVLRAVRRAPDHHTSWSSIWWAAALHPAGSLGSPASSNRE